MASALGKLPTLALDRPVNRLAGNASGRDDVTGFPDPMAVDTMGLFDCQIVLRLFAKSEERCDQLQFPGNFTTRMAILRFTAFCSLSLWPNQSQRKSCYNCCTACTSPGVPFPQIDLASFPVADKIEKVVLARALRSSRPTRHVAPLAPGSNTTNTLTKDLTKPLNLLPQGQVCLAAVALAEAALVAVPKPNGGEVLRRLAAKSPKQDVVETGRRTLWSVLLD